MTAPQDVQGPWYVTDGDYLRVREEASDAVIATIEDGGHPEIEIFDAQERERHAWLIAAGPELLQAARALASLETVGGGRSFPSPEQCAQARAAINKALGK